MCGNKTYMCNGCECYVKNMDKATHISDGSCQRNQEKKKKEEEDR